MRVRHERHYTMHRFPYNSSMLDERAQTLLKTLVERYIADGQPVGSRTLSRPAGWSCRRRPSAT